MTSEPDDMLIVKAVRRVKLSVILVVLLTIAWRLLDGPLSWWLLVPLALLANWAVWPAQVWHYRRFRHAQGRLDSR